MIGYLADHLLQAESHSVLMDNVEITMHALQEFGWVFDLTQ